MGLGPPVPPSVGASDVNPREHPLDRAQRWISGAVYAALVSGTLTFALWAVGASREIEGSTAAVIGIVDAALMFGLAFGVSRRSRVAAAALLGVHVLGMLLKLVLSGFPSGVIGGVIFGFFYIRGLLGTIDYHRIQRTRAAGLPSASQAPG